MSGAAPFGNRLGHPPMGAIVTVRMPDRSYCDLVVAGRLPDPPRRHYLEPRRVVVVTITGEAMAVENNRTDAIWTVVTEAVELFH